MRDFKDKDWDRRYENFKILKERRKAIEARSASSGQNQSQSQNSTGRSNTRVHATKNIVNTSRTHEILANKGPSRFLQARNTSLNKNQGSKQPQVQVVQDIGESQIKTFDIAEESSEGGKLLNLSFKEMLPYIFIALGILLIVLVLTNVIKI